jgi:hypothetical protein
MANSGFFSWNITTHSFYFQKKLQLLFFLLPSDENLPEEKP